MSSPFIDSDLLIVKTSESDFENANNLAKKILNMKLAACISFSKINSIYWWDKDISFIISYCRFIVNWNSNSSIKRISKNASTIISRYY